MFTCYDHVIKRGEREPFRDIVECRNLSETVLVEKHTVTNKTFWNEEISDVLVALYKEFREDEEAKLT